MEDYKLGEQETRFADLIWDNTPIKSPDLVKLAAEVMQWKKSTTYTMLRRLCERGIFKNENATVTVALTREQFYGGQSRKYVEDTFGGSLPRFITSFIGGRGLSDKQADELVRLINEHKEGRGNGRACEAHIELQKTIAGH
ncbi:MAG: BlaI/MecI/CopY family transcriptional regulator [Oscillospiraceae bacterium]|nr:BlaI/MecI/CopY family transcriptional regulator [Oscillospiraceae bacterium]